jgi:hypothetical protein
MGASRRVDDARGWWRYRRPHLAATIRSPSVNAMRLRLERRRVPTVPLRIARGTVGGRTITYAYGGHADGLRYIQPFVQDGLLAGAEDLTVEEHAVPRPDLLPALERADADLTTAVLEEVLVPRALPARTLLMPFRIHQAVDTSRPWSEVRAEISRRELKRHEAACRKHGFRLRTTADEAEYRWFYQHMVRPSMEVRYGGRDRSLGEDQGLHAILRHGVLFLVESDDGPVAGSASELDRRRSIVNGRLIGVRDGDQELRRNGAQNALYHFILEYACAHGFAQVDYQGCEPFLSKGTFQYKKRFGTEAVLPPSRYRFLRMLLTPRKDSGRLRDFLVANPIMMVDERGRLGAWYPRDAARPPRHDIPDDSLGFAFRAELDLDALFGAGTTPVAASGHGEAPAHA